MNIGIKLALVAMLSVFSIAVVAFTADIPNTASAQDQVDKGLRDIVSAYPSGATEEKNIGEVAKKIIDWALYFSAILAVIFIIYGGFLYITSAGDATQAGKGRTALVNALIGLVIIVLSYMIVQTVYNFLVT